jgi:tetratricopeptide (TPR) repeat protein
VSDPRSGAARDLQRAQRALEADPRDAGAWLTAGLAMQRLGHEQDALRAFEQLVTLEPGHAEGWLRQGVLHARAERGARAIACYQRAAELRPAWAEAWLRLGTSTFRGGRIRDAEAPLRRALELEPGLWPAAVSLATVLERSRRLDEAEAILRPLAVGASPQATVAMTWAGLQRRRGTPSRALPCVESALASAPVGQQRALLLHAYGDLLDDLGRWEEAFQAFAAANRARGFTWSAAEHHQRVSRLLDAFEPEQLAAAAQPAVDASRVVYIVGMPRSGTTLLEQILAGHSAVAGAGELDVLRRVGLRISAAMGAPGCWFQQPAVVPVTLLEQGAGLVLDALDARRGEAALVTDKMPDNFLQLGLARCMLPGCRVIHLRRDPLDTCWSCFRQPFAQGLAWACSLEDIAAYHADYRRVMDHWERVLDLPVLELRYEELVGQPEAAVRRVLGYLGLELEPGCLQFHRSERLVSTASHAAVQEPLHQRAVGRAEPYQRWLGPLIDSIDR